MDFGFTDEQEQLRRAAADFLAREMPASFARAMLEDPEGFPPKAWQQLADLGWLGLAVPESLGGSGLGLLDLVLVLEEAGAVLLPGPFATTVSLALPLLLAAADEEQKAALVPALVAGTRRIAAAVAEKRGRWESSAIEARAVLVDGKYVLEAEKLFVPDAGCADDILVAALTDDGLGFFLVAAGTPGLRVTPMDTVDRTRRLFTVRAEGVRLEADRLLGKRGGGEGILEEVIDRAKVAVAAGMVGAAERTLEMTVEYTGLREQFGRVLATFQAVQHRAADMKVAVEHARSLVYYAAWACDTSAPDRRLAAAMAKAFASEACPRVAADAVQLHGGIGFTWEHDLHLYFKRLKADEATYGDATANRETVARILEEMP
jgi:alkylation response protein AidB-like acyl-CoA dehydrogenase